MSDFPEPPRADPRNLKAEFHALARPLYELVNQDPETEPYPKARDAEELRIYQALLARGLLRVIDELQPVSCKRVPGLAGRSPAWTEYAQHVHRGRVIDGDINELVTTLGERTEDISVDTAQHAFVPEDLLARSLWFYRRLQYEHRLELPPFDPNYGQRMCQILAVGMNVNMPYELLQDIFPFLISNPPLGFVPHNDTVYRVLVP